MDDAHRLYVINLVAASDAPRDEALVRRHVAFLRELDHGGRLVLAGPFEDGGGGMIVIRADSLDHARALAADDPFVSSGSRSCTVRAWLLSNEENNHQGMG